MKNSKNLKWILTTIVLILVTAFSIAGTVISKNDFKAGELEQYYLQKEKQLTEDVRDFLNQKGYRNSGVTVTRVVESNGNREYTVTVHHGDIDRMTEGERTVLAGEMGNLTFEDEHCTFSMNFL